MTDLRVATFNIRNGFGMDGRDAWPFRHRATAAAVAKLDAEVVGLQEVYRFQLRSILRRVDDVDAVGEGRGAGVPFGLGRGEHNPLLVARGEVRVLGHTTRWYGETPDRPGRTALPGARFPRIATLATVAVGSAASTVQVACTHLDARSAEHRARSAQQLVSWLDPSLPRVVLGDLNAGPDAAELDALYAAGLRQALPREAGGTNHDFTGRTDGTRIDHILVSDAIEVVHAEVAHPRPGGRLPSDHWPVVADLRI